MITAELIQQTEARFAERKPARQESETKIRTGRILEADTPERVKARLRRITTASIETEGVGLPAPGQVSGPAVTALERILLKNDLMSVAYLEIGVRVARTIARIHVPGGYGTGFMVSPRLLLTNNHVLENASVAGASRAEFDFQEGADRRLRSSVFVDLDPGTFFVTDRALDFSLVALRGDPRNVARLGYNGLTAAEGKVIVGEYMSIIQHPGGERKQLALRENQLVDVLPNFLHYKTDTAPGSSGSPVFNDQWEVVALHHSGVPRKDSQGRILTKDGQVWTSAMGEQRIHWIANEGVRVSRILSHLQGLSLSGGQAALRQQLLAAQAGFRGDLTARELVLPGMDGGETESTLEQQGERRWTLPLEISIGVGQGASAVQLSGGTPRPAEAGAATPTSPGDGAAEQFAPPAQDELSAWRAIESVGVTVPPESPQRAETALEWLTRESNPDAKENITPESQFEADACVR